MNTVGIACGLAIAACALGDLCSAGQAQLTAMSSDGDGQLAPEVTEALTSWFDAHGPGWRAVANENGECRAIYGTTAVVRSDIADDIARAQHYVQLCSDVIRVSPHSLHPRRMGGVQSDSDGKTSVVFLQEFEGIEVLESRVGVLMGQSGQLIAISADCVRRYEHPVDVIPSVTVGSAMATASEWMVQAEDGLTPDHVRTKGLVFVRQEARKALRLAWRIRVERNGRGPGLGRISKEAYIDAANGEVLFHRDLIHRIQSHGPVKTKVTAGTGPPGGPTAEVIAPHVRIRDNPNVNVGVKYDDTSADSSGRFVLKKSGVLVPLPEDLAVSYYGELQPTLHPIIDVKDETGQYTLERILYPATGSILMNPGGTTSFVAQGNTYYWLTRVYEWLSMWDPAAVVSGPGELWPAPVVAHTNVGSELCNAFYDQGVDQLFFGVAGGVGGPCGAFLCPNSAYSSVVIHEMGHYLNNLYGPGNGWSTGGGCPGGGSACNDGFGEGAADTWSMYILASYGESMPYEIGRGFKSGATLRTGQNTRLYQGQYFWQGQPCGTVHDDGEVLMGAMWNVRERLVDRHGASSGGDRANDILVKWMKSGSNSGHITASTVVEVLLADDDDGLLANGTPNGAEIDMGFRIHGFPAQFVGSAPKIVVSSTASGPAIGTPSNPLSSFAAGISAVDPGGTVEGSGVFNETPLTISKPCTITGSCTIK